MKYASVTDRLATLGGDKWIMRVKTLARANGGLPTIDMTIGEPDVPTPTTLLDVACTAMCNGRTGYSDGRGEPALLTTLAERYSRSTGRRISSDNILCFPGTQTALYAVFSALVEAGDDVLVGDPMYATYEGVIRATGAGMIAVPLLPGNGFRMQAESLAAQLTGRTRVILLNSPHNPTGAILHAEDIQAIGEFASEHDLWIVVDEVYEEMVFEGAVFRSPLAFDVMADRVIAVSSISKSHAAAGFRSGWCVGPADFCNRLLPLSETMLFGNQPFIADMTAVAVADDSAAANDMSKRYGRRAQFIHEALHGKSGLGVHKPDAGMFALLDISCTGMSGDEFADRLLDEVGVGVMPGSSFGESLPQWVRLALTVDDESIKLACEEILSFTKAHGGDVA